MDGQQNKDKINYTEMDGQQNKDKINYTEMDGQQNIKICTGKSINTLKLLRIAEKTARR
jgi:hypothetical protein